MTTLNRLDLAISLCFIAVTLKLTINGFRSLLFLRRAHAQHQRPVGQLPYFAILIPVLREQNVIAETIRHFAAIDYPSSRFRIVLITTEREQWERDQHLVDQERAYMLRYRGGITDNLSSASPSHLAVTLAKSSDSSQSVDEKSTALPLTSTIIDKTIDVVNAKLGAPVARRIHYPFTKGHMAHQVNYAVRYLFEVIDEGIDPSAVFVALYNADSRPDLSVLNMAANLIARAPDRNVALQQHSAYRAVHVPASFEGAVLQAARLWQTRWSLCVELPRAIRATALLHPRARWLQGRPWKQLRTWLLPFNYAIGHGLFVRLRELVLLNYMPESTRNEDAPFGYLLLLAGIPLIPLPCMDNAEVPRSVPSLVTQQSNWYRGPLDAMLYLRLARARRLVGGRSLPAMTLTVRALYDAFVWLVGPCLFFVAIFSFPISSSPLFLLGVFLLFFLLPSLPALARLAGSSPVAICQAFLALPLFYLLHGLGAILGARGAFVEMYKGQAVPKLKTER